MSDVVKHIGAAALYLASDASNLVNGEAIYADGGQHLAGGPVFSPGKFIALS